MLALRGVLQVRFLQRSGSFTLNDDDLCWTEVWSNTPGSLTSMAGSLHHHKVIAFDQFLKRFSDESFLFLELYLRTYVRDDKTESNGFRGSTKRTQGSWTKPLATCDARNGED